MNFLAHLYLADETPESIIGNMLGDFIDADFREKYSPEICRGIVMHQKIDQFTDSHPVFRQSKRRIDKDYRHLKGIMIDLFYDHFLAKNWQDYSDEPLEDFCERIYETFQAHKSLLAPRLQRILPYMIEENWLTSYRRFEGIGWALSGISRRISRKNILASGLSQLEENYDGFDKDFQAFFPELSSFANELILAGKSPDNPAE